MFFSSEVFVRILFRSLIFVLARQIIDSSYRKVNLVDGYGKRELVYEKKGRVNWSGGIGWGRGWYSRGVRLDFIPLLQRRTICISSINAKEFWRLYTDTCRIDRYNLNQLTKPSSKFFCKHDPIFLLKT